MSISSILNIGTTALLTAQKAMNTVSNNIANASTEGYTRQTVVLSSLASVASIANSSGNGVTVSAVTRMYDALTTLQLRTEKSNAAYWDTYSSISSTIETVFDETSTTGIAATLSDFINAWQAVASEPSDSTARSSLLSTADYLCERISGAYETLNSERNTLYKTSQDLVTQVNDITSQIAELNDKIVASPDSLELQDQRDLLVEQLNEIVSVSVVEDGDGKYNVYLDGNPIVSSSGSYDLSLSLDSSNNMQFVLDSGMNVTDSISGGSLGANLDARDTTIVGYMNSLNAMAISLSEQVNYYNSQGYGLDGSTGIDFFTSLVDITDSSTSGTASSVTVSDVSEYSETSGAQYRITYNTTGGAGYQQEGSSGLYWTVEQSADGGTTWSTVPTSDVTLSYDTTSTDPTSRTLTAGGLTMQIDGAQSDLLTDASGTFVVETDANAASNMSVAITDTDEIAAASDSTLLPGDNTNAQAIADLLNSGDIINGETAVEFYAEIVSQTGLDASSADTSATYTASLVTSLETQRTSVSGVNLDEEAVKLVQYQTAYEAAAKLITVADEILETLIDMI
jgi:flagellar hook-associated protein 1